MDVEVHNLRGQRERVWSCWAPCKLNLRLRGIGPGVVSFFKVQSWRFTGCNWINLDSGNGIELQHVFFKVTASIQQIAVPGSRPQGSELKVAIFRMTMFSEMFSPQNIHPTKKYECLGGQPWPIQLPTLANCQQLQTWAYPGWYGWMVPMASYGKMSQVHFTGQLKHS